MGCSLEAGPDELGLRLYSLLEAPTRLLFLQHSATNLRTNMNKMSEQSLDLRRLHDAI
jgi:hypothetical protein